MFSKLCGVFQWILFCLILLLLVMATSGCQNNDEDKESASKTEDNTAQVDVAQNVAQLVELTTIDPDSEIGFGYTVSPDGKTIAVTTANGLRLFDTATGTPGGYVVDESATGSTFSPDGTKLAIGTENGLRVYDITTATLGDYLIDELVYETVFSADGTFLGAYGRECSPGWCIGTIYVVNVETGEEVLRSSQEGYISDIAFSPEGSLFAYGLSKTSSAISGNQRGTVLDSGEIHVIDIANDPRTDYRTLNHPEAVYGDLFFNADGSQLAYNALEWRFLNPAPDSGRFYIYDLEKDETVQALAKGGLVDAISPDWKMAHAQGSVIWGTSVSFGPDSFVATLQTKEDVISLARFREVDFSLDPGIAAILGADLEATTAIRNVETGDNIVAFDVEGAENTRDLFLQLDGTLMVLRWWNESGQYLTIWGIPGEGSEVVTQATPADAPIAATEVTAAAPAASTPTDSPSETPPAEPEPMTVLLSNQNAGQMTELARLDHGRIVNGISFSPDGALLASAGFDNLITVWEVASGNRIKVLSGHAGIVADVSFSPDGTLLASGSHDDTVRVWDVASGDEIFVLEKHTGVVENVSFSPDGTLLASGGYDDTVRIWDVASGDEITVLEGHESITALSFSPDGKLLVSSNGGNVRLWNVSTWTEISTLESQSEGGLWDLAFSSDNNLLAAASHEGLIYLWRASDTSESYEPLPPLEGHSSLAYTVAFHPDSTLLASAEHNGQIRIWDTTSGLEIVELKGQERTGAIFCLGFSPDGTLLASGSWDGIVRLWGVAYE